MLIIPSPYNLSKTVLVLFAVGLFGFKLRADEVKLTFSVTVNEKLVNLVDQGQIPFADDPTFVPFQMPVAVSFDNSLRSVVAFPNGTTDIDFGPELALYSPLTASLRYGPENPVGVPFIETLDDSPDFRGSYIDLGQFSNEAPDSSTLDDYNWALVSPLSDPRYPPLTDPEQYTTGDLMEFLQLLQSNQTALRFSQVSYQMLSNVDSPLAFYGIYYPYMEEYNGTAIIQSVEVLTPEPYTVFLVVLALSLLWLTFYLRRIQGQ